MFKKIAKVLIVSIVLLLLFGMPVCAAARLNSKAEVESYLQKQILNRKEYIEIQSSNYDISLQELSKMVDAVAKKKTKGNSSSGDYQYENLRNRYYCKTVISEGSEEIYRYTLTITYLETFAQTRAVDRKVQSILRKLKIKRCSPYEKVKRISEWIVRNVQYDYSYKNRTAYKALYSKTATCMGYGLLAYKLFSEAGINSRIITGEVKSSGAHMWNAVKLYGKYYYIDTCWMDSSGNRKTPNYNYFLFGKRKCNKERLIDKGYQLGNLSRGYFRKY